MAGMPARAAVFYDSGPVFETTDGFKGTVLREYPGEGIILASGFLQGEPLIQGKAAALDVELGDGHDRAARLPAAVARSAVRHVPRDLQRDRVSAGAIERSLRDENLWADSDPALAVPSCRVPRIRHSRSCASHGRSLSLGDKSAAAARLRISRNPVGSLGRASHLRAGSRSARCTRSAGRRCRATAISMLRLYGQSRGRGAEYWGADYLDVDRWVRTMGVPARAAAWAKQQTPEAAGALKAFADGINALRDAASRSPRQQCARRPAGDRRAICWRTSSASCTSRSSPIRSRSSRRCGAGLTRARNTWAIVAEAIGVRSRAAARESASAVVGLLHVVRSAVQHADALGVRRRARRHAVSGNRVQRSAWLEPHEQHDRRRRSVRAAARRRAAIDGTAGCSPFASRTRDAQDPPAGRQREGRDS